MRLSLEVLVVTVFAALLSYTVDARPTNDDLDLEVLRDIISLLSKRDSLFKLDPRRPGGGEDKDQKGGEGERPTGDNIKGGEGPTGDNIQEGEGPTGNNIPEGEGPTGDNIQESEPSSPPAEKTDQRPENQVNGGEEKAESNGENAENVPGDLQNKDGEQGDVSEPNEDKQGESQDGEKAGVEQDTQQIAPGSDVEEGAEEKSKVEENDKPPKPEEDVMSQAQAGKAEEQAEAPTETEAAAQSSPSDSEDENNPDSENLESLEKERQNLIKGLEKMMREALEESDVGEAKQLLDKLNKHLETSGSYNQKEQTRLEAVSEKLKMAENNLESAAALTSSESSEDENSEQETDENTAENDRGDEGKQGDLVSEDKVAVDQSNEAGNLQPGEESNPNNSKEDDIEKDGKEDKNNKENPEGKTGKTEGDQETTSDGGAETGIIPPRDDLLSQSLKERRNLLKKLELIQTLRKLKNDFKA